MWAYERFLLMKTQSKRIRRMCSAPAIECSHKQCCEGSDVDSFTDRWAQSYKAAAARTRTLTSAVLFGAFLKTAALVQSHAHIMTCSLCKGWPFLSHLKCTIYKGHSIAFRMSCKPQLSLQKRIQQAGFIYKNSLQKNLENTSLFLNLKSSGRAAVAYWDVLCSPLFIRLEQESEPERIRACSQCL